MEVGQVCRLLLREHATASPASASGPPGNHSKEEHRDDATVTVVLLAIRPHAEDPTRRLYYARCTHIDLSPDLQRQRRKLSTASASYIGSGSIHSCNELRLSNTSFMSADGYYYRYDGWYDASMLQPFKPSATVTAAGDEKRSTGDALSLAKVQLAMKEEETGEKEEKVTKEGAAAAPAESSSPPTTGTAVEKRAIPEEWLTAMERDTAVCEVVYLCYAFQPWFAAPYTALQYLALPEDDVCHSVYLCHRCLSPFFTREQYFVHLEGEYCLLRCPPGHVLYHDETTGYKVYLVDGAKHLHYCRCLSLVGKHFIESKLLSNDVDLYEYVLVTMPRAFLPYGGDNAMVGVTRDEFQQAAAAFDVEDWDGDVVMGYVSRLKHQPDHTLSCIVTLPIFQRMRVATFMLDVAYWMTGQRQRRCGGERCCGRNGAGGAISRPFSPHGQSLLLSYWRRALLRSLNKVAPRRRASRIATAEPVFTLAELQALVDTPLHPADLQMLLLQSDFAFYSAATTTATASSATGGPACANGAPSGRADNNSVEPETASSIKKTRREAPPMNRRGTHASGSTALPATSLPSTASSAPAGQRYTATLVLEEATLDAAEEKAGRPSLSRPRGGIVRFEKRWLLKDARGAYVYDVPLFHY